MVISTMIECYWYYYWVLNFDLSKCSKKVKKSEYSKVSHSKKPGREKVLNFTVGINITPPNYSFMPKNCFKLLFCAKLISDTSYLSQQNIFSGHTQALLVFFLLQYLM